MLKNKSYEHEKEVRALIVTPLEGMPIPEEGVVAPSTGPLPKEGFDLPLNNLNDFIDEIVVNPFCQDWFLEAVSGLAGRYGVQGKHRKSSLSPDLFYMSRSTGT